MRVLFINNDAGGFADHVEIEEGMTVGQFFFNKVGGEQSRYITRVNRQPATADQVLKADDRITITPTKIDGAN